MGDIILAARLQITASLLEPVWGQWVADTQSITAALAAALAAPQQAQQPLLLVFERWLLQLKVGGQERGNAAVVAAALARILQHYWPRLSLTTESWAP